MPTPLTSSAVTSVNFVNVNTIDSLLTGKRWVNPLISYSFPNRESWWSTDESLGYGAQLGIGEPWQIETDWLTSNDQVNFERALQQWANVANVAFTKIIETANEVGDIRVAYTKADELTLAWSYLPGSSVRSRRYLGEYFRIIECPRLEPWHDFFLKRYCMKLATHWALNILFIIRINPILQHCQHRLIASSTH